MCVACNPGLLAFMRAGRSRRSVLAATGAMAAAGVFGSKTGRAQTTSIDGTGWSRADTIFVNGPILTMNPAAPNAEALAVRGGRIVAVGSRDEVMALQGPGTKLVNLGGTALLPGFTDPHMHAGFTFFESWIDVGPFALTTFAEVVAKLKSAAGSAAPDTWIRANQFDPVLTKGAERIDRALLDRIAPDHPLFLYESNGHVAYANTSALGAAGITRDTPDPPLARYKRDASGELTGRLEEAPAFFPFIRKMPMQTAAESQVAIRRLFDRAASQGCTGLFDCGIGMIAGPQDLATLHDVMRSDPPIRYGGALVSTSMKDWLSMGLQPGAGDDRFDLPAIKAWSDGSNQGFSGYLRDPYLNSQNRGTLNYTQAQLTETIRQAHGLGWQVCVHSNGDAAIDTTLDAYEAALGPAPRADHRHRIEHCSILHDGQIARMQRLGLSPSFLIGHVYYWGRAFRNTILGPDRADRLDPCASALRGGLRFSLHSDWNVTEIEPLRMIENAVTRRMRDGGAVLAPSERVTVAQALSAMTLDAAWQCRRDAYSGSLQVGKYADLVQLGQDPRAVDPEAISAIKVVATWLEGQVRYEA